MRSPFLPSDPKEKVPVKDAQPGALSSNVFVFGSCVLIWLAIGFLLRVMWHPTGLTYYVAWVALGVAAILVNLYLKRR